MKTLIIRTIIFLLPLILLLSLVVTVHVRFNEFADPALMLESHQTKQPILYGKQYIPSKYDFKEAIIEKFSPEIISMGNSRSLQIREEFFKTEYSFYNFTDANNLRSLLKLLSEIKNGAKPKPKLLILVMGQMSLSPAASGDLPDVAEDGIGETKWLQILQSTVKDLISQKITLPNLFNPQPYPPYRLIGTRANVNHVGLRNDGSYSYGDIIPGHENPKHEDHQFKYSLRMIDRGLSNWKHAESPATSTLAVYEDFLNQADHMDIHVVTILPPYAPTNFAAMDFNRDYAYIPEAVTKMQQIHRQYEHSFYDFTNPDTLGLSDADFFDGIHWSETANALALIEIAKTDHTLAEYLNLESLTTQTQVASKQDPRPRYLFR